MIRGHKALTIERLDAGQVLLPAHVLAVNLSEVADKEGVLVTWVAGFMVDGFHALAKRIANHMFGQNSSIVMVVEE